MRPFTTGSDYVNQIGLETDEGSERIKAAFEVNYDRLVALKNKYDPTKVFRRNVPWPASNGAISIISQATRQPLRMCQG